MTSESLKRKRKRGPPEHASEIDNDASKQHPATRRSIRATETNEGRDELETNDDPRHKKRIRSKKGPAASDSRSLGSPSRKTARRYLAHESGPDEITDEDGSGESSILQPRRSGRKRHSATEMRWIFNTVSPEDPATIPRQQDQGAAHPQAKKRGRPSLKEASVSGEQGYSPSEASSQKKRPGRPSLQNSRKGDTSDSKRQAGASKAAKTALSEASELGQRRRSRPRILDHPVPNAPRSRAPAPSTSRGLGRRSNDSAAPRREVASRTKRHSSRAALVGPDDSGVADVEGDGNEGDKAASPSRYHRLVSRKRSIPLSTITAKWSPLEQSSIAVIGSIMYDAQRTVLSHIPDKNFRRDHAHAAMSAINRRLKSKLVKGMPFPPPSAKISAAMRKSDSRPNKTTGTHEEELNFEKTVNHVQTLHKQLGPLQHSVAVLQREKERQEAALEKDYEDLHVLEANARAEVRTWQQRGRRAHILAPGIRKPGEQGGSASVGGGLEIVQKDSGQIDNLFKTLDDEELLSLSKQTSSHMESMKDNLQQVDGILPEITKSRSALQGVLRKHLGMDQYDQAVLG